MTWISTSTGGCCSTYMRHNFHTYRLDFGRHIAETVCLSCRTKKNQQTGRPASLSDRVSSTCSATGIHAACRRNRPCAQNKSWSTQRTLQKAAILCRRLISMTPIEQAACLQVDIFGLRGLFFDPHLSSVLTKMASRTPTVQFTACDRVYIQYIISVCRCVTVRPSSIVQRLLGRVSVLGVHLQEVLDPWRVKTHAVSSCGCSASCKCTIRGIICVARSQRFGIFRNILPCTNERQEGAKALGNGQSTWQPQNAPKWPICCLKLHLSLTDLVQRRSRFLSQMEQVILDLNVF